MNPPATSGTERVENVSIEKLLQQIAQLPRDWHGCGSVSMEMLRALARHTEGREVRHSVETGSGKTTLLFSHISQDHKVFAVDYANSVSVVRASSLLRADRVEFIEGPTQRTLPRRVFEQKLDVVLIDGPHSYPFPELEYWHLYPHLATSGLLIVDDIHIPTIWNMFRFLKEERMFELREVVGTTAFFARTDAPLFDPFGDNWQQQNYNLRRCPIPISLGAKLKSWIPRPLRKGLSAVKQKMVRNG